MWSFGRFSGAESQVEAAKTAGVLFPLTPPSPPGEGETFASALVIRPSLVVLCLRSERHGSGECNRNVRVFQHRSNVLPLLGERVGVRGNESNSNPRRATTPRDCQTSRVVRQSPGVSEFDSEFCNA